jgi:DnaJ-domain-containing protein 1
MGIFDRLEEVLKSNINSSSSSGWTDPDMAEAEAELNDYLNGKGPADSTGGAAHSFTFHFDDDSWDARFRKATGRDPGGPPPGGYRTAGSRPAGPPPESLRVDYAELGIAFGSDLAAVRKAYKRLLKEWHPDKHAGNSAELKKATEKSARINAAYDRIEQWLQS